ncbi:MAG: 5-carboxymethyl-2-hydroxymuconate Delta-isomerase [Planctomycetaceae bacterium]|nr:5-carboxymethyl-2-hydroxymuconate Delta-isomerase [Planctomycetaceae bacterium]
MRLATLETESGRKVTAVGDGAAAGNYIDLHAADPTLPTCPKALLALPDGLKRAAVAKEQAQAKGLYVTGRLLAPIPVPGKIICIGLNYKDHAAESGQPIPSEPVCFSKFSTAAIGPEAEIRLPKVANKVDYEAELVVVIGKRGKHIPKEKAFEYIAGYTNGNDVSARDWQIGRPGGQWLIGKTPDTFAPMGPYLVTADEIADPHELQIQFRLNGQTLQNSNTKELIFKLDELVAHLSQFVTLDAGDVIFTGTPPGVGAARKPPVFMKPGDLAEVEIAGLGILKNFVVADE